MQAFKDLLQEFKRLGMSKKQQDKLETLVKAEFPAAFKLNPNWIECSYCKEQKPNAKQERYSAGCYAGRMCDDCAYSRYRDHCGLGDTPQLTQADVDEPIEPEPYYGSRNEWPNRMA